MARKKAMDGEVSIQGQKPNIEGLDLLAKEYRSGKMPERKLVALRIKLMGLYTEGVITDSEQELMEAILRKERNLSRILSRDEYLLNTIESERCEEVAVVKTDDAPTVHHLHKGLECRFRYDPEYNDGKQRPDSLGRYYVYVPRVVPPEHQLSVATVRKENLGHPTSPDDYPPPRILIHRLVLKTQEFKAWFEVEDETLLATEAQPEYTF
jgi:hypothetical protein